VDQLPNPENLHFTEQGVMPAVFNESKPLVKLTIVETVYFQAPNEDPQQFSNNVLRVLTDVEEGEDPEQPYVRNLTADKEWTPLDFGWLTDNVSLFIVRNNEGKFSQVIPTEEMRATSNSKHIELGVYFDETIEETGLVVLPSETLRATPKPSAKFFVRCLNGKAKFTLQAFPR